MDLGEFSAKDITGPVRLVTRARDIKLEQFTQSVELETERGDIELTPGKLPLAAIEARSGAGKIELRAARKGRLPARRHRPARRRSQRLRPADREGSRRPRRHPEDQVGADGPMIKLTANRGWISVRKEGTLPSEVPAEELRPPNAPRPPKPPKALKDLKDSEVKM